jgi:hypothetical protein
MRVGRVHAGFLVMYALPSLLTRFHVLDARGQFRVELCVLAEIRSLRVEPGKPGATASGKLKGNEALEAMQYARTCKNTGKELD